MHELLTPKEVSKLLKVAEVTLATWRQQKRGPKYIKVNNKFIRYSLSDIKHFLNKYKC